MKQNKIIVFESKRIWRVWNKEEWYFSVVDVCGALTDQSEVVTICHQLKLKVAAWKKR
jgi:prophage antirepressor-like protein